MEKKMETDVLFRVLILGELVSMHNGDKLRLLYALRVL